MLPASLIAAKRDSQELTDAEIAFFIQGFAAGSIPDYQMSAMAMAIYLNGMTPREVATLTSEMLLSGSQLTWPRDGIARVDKHSTGGIGDKTSLILAPLLAECGVQVPMLSGRGLGATGGTLDKLEAIPGFRTDLSLAEITRLTQSMGCVITGASPELAPADRKLYALRDVTATVPSIPLITGSIMSKKLAESLGRTGARCEIWQRCVYENAKTGNGTGAFARRYRHSHGSPHNRAAHRHESAAWSHVRKCCRSHRVHRCAQRRRTERCADADDGTVCGAVRFCRHRSQHGSGSSTMCEAARQRCRVRTLVSYDQRTRGQSGCNSRRSHRRPK